MPLMDECIKMRYICILEYYPSIKNNEIMPFAAKWVKLEHIMLSEICDTQKNNYLMFSLIGRS
jgi:hypothetical protein